MRFRIFKIMFVVCALFCANLASADFGGDFGSDLSAKSSADFQVFALSNFDKKLLENGTFKGYLMSEKLDGVRALWDGKILKSRSGRIFSVPKCWLKNLPPFELDGELFIARGEFEKVLSIVSKGENKCEQCKCEEWQNVGYFVFDVPNCRDFQNADSKNAKSQSTELKNAKSCTLLERLAVLEIWLKNRADLQKDLDFSTDFHNASDLDFGAKSILQIIPQMPIDSQNALESKLKEITKLGGEGLVVRKNSAPYERFRTTNAMKLKSYEDAECVIIAHNLGKGKYANALGSITCESKSLLKSAQQTAQKSAQQNKEKNSDNKIRFKIGSGFSDKERANPPPIGTTITYKYYGLTKNGLPRFPIFLRIYAPQ